MLDHIGIAISDFERSRLFMIAPGAAGYRAGDGSDRRTDRRQPRCRLWFKRQALFLVSGGKPPGHAHIAFVTQTRAKVDAFYKAALAAGGTDNGPPGLRPHYHKDYYGAFVLDPDGHNIEAVCHLAE